MYDPFVRACNYALDKLSKIKDVGGLPKFLPENQIVFINNHNRSVGSESVQRNSLTRPDIVVLQWDDFMKKLKRRVRYSESYGELCVSCPRLELSWRDVRTTVEMKMGRISKDKQGTQDFNSNFKDLKELLPYVALDDVSQPGIMHQVLPDYQCVCPSFWAFP